MVASHTGGQACVCELSAGIELSQPTISHHLKVLRTADLVECRAARFLGVLPSDSASAAAPFAPTRVDSFDERNGQDCQ